MRRWAPAEASEGLDEAARRHLRLGVDARAEFAHIYRRNVGGVSLSCCVGGVQVRYHEIGMAKAAAKTLVGYLANPSAIVTRIVELEEG
jgi:hypothetical protein